MERRSKLIDSNLSKVIFFRMIPLLCSYFRCEVVKITLFLAYRDFLFMKINVRHGVQKIDLCGLDFGAVYLYIWDIVYFQIYLSNARRGKLQPNRKMMIPNISVESKANLFQHCKHPHDVNTRSTIGSGIRYDNISYLGHRY